MIIIRILFTPFITVILFVWTILFYIFKNMKELIIVTFSSLKDDFFGSLPSFFILPIFFICLPFNVVIDFLRRFIRVLVYYVPGDDSYSLKEIFIGELDTGPAPNKATTYGKGIFLK